MRVIMCKIFPAGLVRGLLTASLLILGGWPGVLAQETGGAASGRPPSLSLSPSRIVSLNLCTDQLLMMLVAPSRIAALSRFSRQPAMSVMARQASGLPVTSGAAEEVFMLKPDLILAGTFTSRATLNLLRRKLKQKIIELAPAGSFADIAANIRRIGEAVHEPDQAARLIALMSQRLKAAGMKTTTPLPLAALYFANGYSSGRKTLVDTVVRKGGFETLGQRLDFFGTKKLSLETLILSQPDLLILGTQKYSGEALAYEIFRHPAMRHLKQRTTHIALAEALTLCGTPHTVRAVEQLRQFQKVFLSRQKATAMGSGNNDE